MLTNPFDDEAAIFYAVVNDKGERAIWPASVAIPAGWRAATGPGTRQDCLDHIETTWTGVSLPG